MVYGWEMALVVGAAYWFVHANLESLWQMAGVSIPALLMLAAGLATVDARAGTLWPRISRRWARNSAAIEGDPPGDITRGGGNPDRGPTASGTVPDAPATESGGSLRRPKRKRRSSNRLRPPGPLSQAFRVALLVLSAVVMVVAGLSYSAMRIQTSALALSRTDPLAAAGRAASARWFAPGDAGPYVTQASIFNASARDALAFQQQDRAGAALDDLALAITAREKAIAKEPADWTNYYLAAWATLDLLAGNAYATGGGGGLKAADATGLFSHQHDWSGLAGTGTVPVVGTANGTLARGDASVRAAQKYRDLSQRRLLELASGFIAAAHERNPLEPLVNETTQLIQKLSTQ